MAYLGPEPYGMSGAQVGGNLAFAGTGNRITGDFHNATRLNRVLFQDAVNPNSTSVGAIPNGTGAAGYTSNFTAWGPTPDNGSFMQMLCQDGVGAGFVCGAFGTGVQLPMDFTVAGTNRLRITTGGVLQGPGFTFQNLNANTTTYISLLPNGTAINTGFTCYNGQDPNNAGWVQQTIDANYAYLISGKQGTGTALPLSLQVAGSERMRITASAFLVPNFTIQQLTANANTYEYIIPNGTATNSGLIIYNNSNTANCGVGQMLVDPNYVYFTAAKYGSGASPGIAVQTNGSNRILMDAAGAQNSYYASSLHLFDNAVRTGNEFQSTYAYALRMVNGNYGACWYHDGSNVYLMFTNSGNQYGAYNALRPFSVNDANGAVTMGNGCTVSGGLTSNGAITMGQQNAIYLTYSGGQTVLRGDTGLVGCGFINNAGNAWLMQIKDNGALVGIAGISYCWGDVSNMGSQYNGTGSNGGHCENANTLVLQTAQANVNIYATKQSVGGTLMWFGVAGAGVGSIGCNTTTTTYATTSDYRLKEQVENLTGSDERIAAIRPVAFTWKSNGQAGRGFIAHELQEIEPDAVSGVKDGMIIDPGGVEVPDYQGVDNSFLVPDLVATVQRLLKRVATLEAALAAKGP